MWPTAAAQPEVDAGAAIADTIFDGSAFHRMKSGCVFRARDDGYGAVTVQIWRPDLLTSTGIPR